MLRSGKNRRKMLKKYEYFFCEMFTIYKRYDIIPSSKHFMLQQEVIA